MINNVLKEARLRIGLTQRDVAKKLRLDSGGTQYISNLERGACFLAPNHLKAICKLYELSYEKIATLMVKEINEAQSEKIRRKYEI